MAANGYNPYNYQSYQQSSAQQYPTYQTAPATNSTQQPSRQYQHIGQTATTQGTDYMSYPAQSYGNQSNTYGDGSWAGSNYGANRESTRGAAEALRNMSNNAYSSNTTASAGQPGFTATNNATSAQSARYGNASPAQHQTQPPHSSHSYGHSQNQTQTRPRSVNANRAQINTNRGLPSPSSKNAYPLQRTHTIYSQQQQHQQQQQRSASPAQPQYNRTVNAPASSTRSAAITAASTYTDYSHRQLPSVDMPRSNQSAAIPTSYSYTDTPQATATVTPSASTNLPEPYNQGTVTVDPMAVYDPWPQYQRQQEEILKQKAADDAARAEKERKAEEARQKEQKREEEDKKRAEEQERARQAAQQKDTNKQSASTMDAGNSSASQEGVSGVETDLEAEIRAMMSKMRELNGKDPALLARIWEEERRAKVPPKSPTMQAAHMQSKATPATTTAQPAQANQRNKAVPRENSNQATPYRPQPATPTMQQPASSPHSAVVTGARALHGNTIWPPEKKVQLAHAAATYLNDHNANKSISHDSVLSMLNSNPSYVELCVQLELMGLKLERGAFAKSLLNAVPDVNSASKSQAQLRGAQPSPLNGNVQRAPAPLAVLTKVDAQTPVTPSPVPTAGSPLGRPVYSPFPGTAGPAAHLAAPVAEMVVIKPEHKPPANKEEAARKRNFNDLIDLTLVDEYAMEPPQKKNNLGYSLAPDLDMTTDSNAGQPPANNFPIATAPTKATYEESPSPQIPSNNIQGLPIVQPLDKKQALRRNAYNIKTIARDVLLACGRHPDERQLNQHLEVLKSSSGGQINNDSDLSTLRWDIIDPGQPPRGYYKDAMQGLADDADDEDDSDDEAPPRPRAPSLATASGANAEVRVQAFDLPAINPFKAKSKRGRPSRHSYPGNGIVSPQTPQRATSSTGMNASDSAPHASSAAAGVGYSAFRSATQYGSDGQPLPKKKGRPVGWRKAIHGSTAAQTRPSPNGYTNSNQFTPSQPSALRNVRTGDNEPITIRSRSNSVANQAPAYQSYRCRWQGCKAELHNLETLKLHVSKLHMKATAAGSYECLWGDCGREVTNFDSNTGIRLEKHLPLAFNDALKLREHLELRHYGPLGWQLGDGPASGLSDAHESDVYLSDAHGRRVTPRLTAEPPISISSNSAQPAPRPRGRPPKSAKERDASETQARMVAQKKRIGGPGIDRGGATLVNDKRRKGFSDDDQTEEEIVDAE